MQELTASSLNASKKKSLREKLGHLDEKYGHENLAVEIGEEIQLTDKDNEECDKM